MRRFSRCGYEAQVDLETTRAWYGRAGDWDCPCGRPRTRIVRTEIKNKKEWILWYKRQSGSSPISAPTVCSR